MLKIAQCELKDANIFIAEHHRHHKPVCGHRFSIRVVDGDRTVGVAVVGRPVARGCNAQKVLEVTRLCTDGTKNACSILYAACARIGRELGYESIQTYVLESESAVSLVASGWKFSHATKGGHWKRSEGTTRRSDQPECPKHMWVKHLQ